MAKFKYIGDPNDRFSGDHVATIHGKTFVKGEVSDDFPEKTDEDKALVKKLSGHSHLLDMSDKDTVGNVNDRQKQMEANAKAEQKAAEDQRKQDEADEKQRQDNLAKEVKKRGDSSLTAENAPRPPGTVTRESGNDPFGGRTVDERTQAEDHTKAGKTTR